MNALHFSHPAMSALVQNKASVWLREACHAAGKAQQVTETEATGARQRFERFAPVLASLFQEDGWDGRVRSPLLDYPSSPADVGTFLIKADHTLPMTGSIKARGGVYELLCHLEMLARDAGLVEEHGPLDALLTEEARALYAGRRVIVASTGNLGFSIGLVARAFGMQAEIHMSHDAKSWKKNRLRRIGAAVVEHACDYEQAVGRARSAAKGAGGYFIDDERSRDLFVGYTTAAWELRNQLAARGIEIGPERPLTVYLPCGVGGAPGGVTWGLRFLFGPHVIPVFVEPIASACVFVAMAAGGGAALSVYDAGLDNDTIADGLAVPKASQLVLDLIGHDIDAVVALPDEEMLSWVRCAWKEAGLRLEPSAASSFAAISYFLANLGDGFLFGRDLTADHVRRGVHVAWTTGGALLPDAEFERLLA
ncbi:MAG: D-serine ammonia-lyase [Pseudomonadota bacterium]